MTQYFVAYKAATKEVYIHLEGDVLAEDYVDIGSFEHDAEADGLGYSENHVFYHHIRDALYHEGVLDMQSVTIRLDPSIDVTGVTIDPALTSIAIAGTYQLLPVVAPATATNKDVLYTSSNELVATVDAAGLITGVVAGTATITITTVDGGFEAVFVVTVT